MKLIRWWGGEAALSLSSTPQEPACPSMTPRAILFLIIECCWTSP